MWRQFLSLPDRISILDHCLYKLASELNATAGLDLGGTQGSMPFAWRALRNSSLSEHFSGNPRFGVWQVRIREFPSPIVAHLLPADEEVVGLAQLPGLGGILPLKAVADHLDDAAHYPNN